MNTQWVETLKAEGLFESVSGQAATRAVAGHYEDQVQLVDLSSLSIVDVTGDDAAAFLQGQLCNDLTKVSVTRAQITGYCTPKGRLLALPAIVGIADGFRFLAARIDQGWLSETTFNVHHAFQRRYHRTARLGMHGSHVRLQRAYGRRRQAPGCFATCSDGCCYQRYAAADLLADRQ